MKASPGQTGKKQLPGVIFLVGIGLLNILTFTLVLCATGFFFHQTISTWQFPLAIVLSIGVNARIIYRRSTPDFSRLLIISSAALWLIPVFSVLIAGLFYDTSYDGQWYHQETVIRLHDHWNPVYENIAVPAAEQGDLGNGPWCTGADDSRPNTNSNTKPPVNLKYININHFPKAMEIVETSIYQLTHRIETGKAVNLLLVFAVFFLAWSVFKTVDSIVPWKKIAFAFLIALNPITITQLFTFCVDGALASVVSILLLSAGLYFRPNTGSHWILAGSAVVLLINIKFTAILFILVIGGGLLLALLLSKNGAAARQSFFTFLTAAVLGISFCGFHPYLTNTIRQGNPFYGIAETKVELRSITPASLLNRNRFTKLFYSLASHTNNAAELSSPIVQYKIPWGFTREDLENAGEAEVKMAALGPFFSGALLAAIVVFFFSLRFRKAGPWKLTMFLLTLILLTLLILPDAWWLRYAPQLWLVPVVLLYMSEEVFPDGLTWVRRLLAVSLMLSVGWSLISIPINMVVSSHIRYQFQQIKAMGEIPAVEYCPYGSFRSNRIRFEEAAISLREEKVGGPFIENVIHSNTRISTSRKLPDLPVPFFLRLKRILPEH